MNCEDAYLLISGRIDGCNTQAEEAQLEEHLAACPDCRRVWLEFSQMNTDLQNLQEEPPAGLCDTVMREVHRQARRKKYRPVWMAAAAALALVMGLQNQQFPQQTQFAQNTRSMDISVASIEPVAADAAAMSQAWGAAVAVTHTLLPELENCEAETLADGTQLFRLEDKDGAAELSRAYGLELYEPENAAEADCSYVWLLP